MLLLGMFVLAGVGVPLSAKHFARTAGSLMIADRAALRAQLVDGIQGMADILAFGRTSQQLARLHASGAAYASGQRLLGRISGLHAGIGSVLTNLALWLSLLIAIPAVRTAALDGISLASVALIVLASFEAVSSLPLAGQLWPATRAAAERLRGVVSVPPAIQPSLVAPPGSAGRDDEGKTPARSRGSPSLELRRVSFTYPGRARPALHDISLRLEVGSSLAVVGPSGAGKSTIANLLLRFWEYDSGEIEFLGSSIRARSPDDARACIGYVSQRPYLFDTSVYENLRLARRRVTPPEVEQAARGAQIHELISALPGGYDTLIGEHGARLSAGERQRLGIARLIIKDAPFLIMDEPSANLDAATEAEVLSILFGLMHSKTSLLITHRLLGMEQIDQIVVMDHGAIVERGTHGSLLAAGGLYWKLWTLQNRQQDVTSDRLAAGP
jgi:ATP-binding cassette subfamily C protein CydC